MSGYGRTVLDNTGRPVEVSADGYPEYKPRGVTVDWDTVAAVAADTVLDDDTPVPSGAKYLRYGQVIVQIGVPEVQTLTFTGGPTAGTATFTFDGEEADAVDFDATAEEVLQALAALPNLGPDGISDVKRTGAGTNGDPYVYRVEFNPELGDVAAITAAHTFTGGTTPTVTIATATAGTGGTGAGKFGPYDPAATDGRQTPTRGRVFILNKTQLESEIHSDHPPAIEGGLLWRRRVLMTTGAASLAAGPTQANVETWFPRVKWADQ